MGLNGGRSPAMRGDVLALIVLMGGLTGTGWLTVWASRQQDEQAQAEFARRVIVHSATLEREVTRAIDAVGAIGGLFESSAWVDEAEFTAFASALLDRQPELRAIEWIPRVPAPLREAHVLAAQAAGHPSYRVHGHPDAEPGVHWPVRYIVPLATNEGALGFDIATEPLRRAAVEAAVASGDVVSSLPIDLVQTEGENLDAVLLIRPVTTAEGAANGVVAVVLDLPALVGALARVHEAEPLDGWLLFDRADGRSLQLRMSGERRAPPDLRSGIVSQGTLSLPGVTFELRHAPAESTLAPRHTSTLAGLGGLLLTCLLAFGLKSSGDQTARQRHLATAVSRANGALEAEIVERRRAEAEVRRLNSELEERVQRGTQEIQTKTTALTEANLRLEEERQVGAMLRSQRLESLGLLAGGVAHDFNNLLTAILGQASLLSEGTDLSEEHREAASEIELAARRAADLVRQLLTYAGRAEQGVTALHVGKVIREIQRLVDASLSKRATLVLRLAEHLPAVEIDGTQLRQVVMNLVTNASDALGTRHGTIEVTARVVLMPDDDAPASWVLGPPSPGEYVEVLVADDGDGMSAPTMERMFEPFFSTKGDQGHGLGLAAVLGVMRSAGGAIQVRSAPGQGTAVRLLLPATLDEAESTSTSVRLEVQQLGAKRVLLVDDEAAVRSLVRSVLQRAGCQVVEAHDGVDAMERFSAEPDGFDLVILDMVMPRMDGAETLVRLRELRPDLPVILSSGYSTAQMDDLPLRVGLFLPKPYRAGDLIAAAQEALSIAAAES